MEVKLIGTFDVKFIDQIEKFIFDHNLEDVFVAAHLHPTVKFFIGMRQVPETRALESKAVLQQYLNLTDDIFEWRQPLVEVLQ